MGIQKLLDLLSPYYTWSTINQEIRNYVKGCETCLKNKTPRGLALGKLSQLGPAKTPFEIVSIDTIGGLSGYNSKKQYLHLAIDHLTRFAWAYCSKTQSAIDFINLVKTIQKVETPKLILADRYTGIRSKPFIRFLEDQNIDYLFTTTDCPQSNGMIERLNQTIINRLRCKLKKNVGQNFFNKFLKIIKIHHTRQPGLLLNF